MLLFHAWVQLIYVLISLLISNCNISYNTRVRLNLLLNSRLSFSFFFSSTMNFFGILDVVSFLQRASSYRQCKGIYKVTFASNVSVQFLLCLKRWMLFISVCWFWLIYYILKNRCDTVLNLIVKNFLFYFWFT